MNLANKLTYFFPIKLRPLAFILVLVVFTLSTGCSKLHNSENTHVGLPFIEVLFDENNSFTFDEVLNKSSGEFEQLQKYFVLSDQTIWIKINAPDIIEKYAKTHYLSLNDNANQIDVYYFKTGKGWINVQGGIYSSHVENKIEILSPTYDLLDIDHNSPIFLRLKSTSLRRIFLLEKSSALYSISNRNLASSFIVGLILFICIINLLRGLRSKNQLVILYAVYVFGLFIGVLAEPTQDIIYRIFDLGPYEKYRLLHISVIYSILFAALYAISFLKLKKDDKVMYYVIMGIWIIFFSVQSYRYIFKIYDNIHIALILGSIVILLLNIVVAGSRAWFAGKKYVGYYLLAYIAFFFCAGIHFYLMVQNIEYPDNSSISYFALGIALEVLFLNMGLNLRIVFERKQAIAEKTEAQSDLIAFKTEQNLILEKKVQQRTKELEEANESILNKSDLLEKSYKEQENLIHFKEGMVNMIAHDMKNSLNAIIGYSASESFNNKMKNINQRGLELLRMVTNMLGIHRFEEASITLNPERLIIKELIDESLLQVALLMQMNSIRTDINVPENQFIKVDGEIMLRVIVNLLTNAIKYSSPGDQISIEVKTKEQDDGNICEIIVADQGEGIDEKALPHIFDKFWQGKAKYMGVAASTGLGLTFCKLAVESHQGSINVDSVKGKGSTFKITLPIEEVVKTNLLDTESAIGSDNSYILNTESEIITKYAQELNTIEVYQIGELKNLINQLNEHNIKSKWKKDLEQAILAGDEKNYKQLINMPLKQ